MNQDKGVDGMTQGDFGDHARDGVRPSCPDEDGVAPSRHPRRRARIHALPSGRKEAVDGTPARAMTGAYARAGDGSCRRWCRTVVLGKPIDLPPERHADPRGSVDEVGAEIGEILPLEVTLEEPGFPIQALSRNDVLKLKEAILNQIQEKREMFVADCECGLIACRKAAGPGLGDGSFAASDRSRGFTHPPGPSIRKGNECNERCWIEIVTLEAQQYVRPYPPTTVSIHRTNFQCLRPEI